VTELEAKYYDRCLSIRQFTPDNVECVAALEGVVEEIGIDILHARAMGDAVAVEKYESLRAFIKDVI